MKIIVAVMMFAFVPVIALAGPSIVGDMNGWNNADPAYDTTLNGNGVNVLTKTLLAGTYQYKAVENDSWDYPIPGGPNQEFTLGADGDVTWFVNYGANVGASDGDEYIFDSTHPPIVAGDMQSELGGSDWDQTDTVNTVMTDINFDDVWEFTAVIAPAGNYQCKVVLNNNWDQNTAPGGNYTFYSDGINPVTFTYDMSNNVTTISTQVVTQQDVTVTFTMCLPDSVGTTGSACVIGSHAAIGGWGTGVDMMQPCAGASPGLWTLDVMFPAGSDPFVEYKYKKDDCATWESTGNHSFNIDDSSASQILPVDGWEYITPMCPDCSSPVEDSSWGAIKGLYR